VVERAGEWQGRSGSSRNGMTRSGSLACYRTTSADALLRPGGTPNRPSSVCRVAFGFEPPGLPPVARNPGRQSPLEQLDLDGAI
jgi:hypothetical protein